VIKRAVLSLEDHFTSERERWGTEIDQRIRRTNNAITAEAACAAKGGWARAPFFAARKIDYTSADPGATNVGALLNRDENTLGADWRAARSPEDQLHAGRGSQADRFRGPQPKTGFVLPLASARGPFDPSASVQGELKVGLIDFVARDQPLGDFRGTIGSARLSTRMDAPRGEGLFDRDLVFSIVASNLSYVGTTWSWPTSSSSRRG